MQSSTAMHTSALQKLLCRSACPFLYAYINSMQARLFAGVLQCCISDVCAGSEACLRMTCTLAICTALANCSHRCKHACSTQHASTHVLRQALMYHLNELCRSSFAVDAVEGEKCSQARHSHVVPQAGCNQASCRVQLACA